MTGTTSKVSSGFSAFADVVPEDVIGALGALHVEISKEIADEVTIFCPAHFENLGRPDRNASCDVNTSSGKFICRSCGFGGRFADLVTYVLQCDRGQAVAWIRTRGTLAATLRLLETLENKPVRPEVSEAKLALYVEPPPDELARRRISPAAARECEVLWDAKRGAWIVPVRDPRTARLLGWQVKRPGYVRNRPYGVEKSRTLFGWHCPVPTDRTGVLVESPLDVAVLRTLGVGMPLASYGTKVSSAQLDLLVARCDRVITFLDHDDAGWLATRKVVKELRRRGKQAAVVTYDGCDWGADPGDLAKLGPEAIGALLGDACPSALMTW